MIVATVTSGGAYQTGAQSAAQRIAHTMPRPMKPISGIIHGRAASPGRPAAQPVRGGGGP